MRLLDLFSGIGGFSLGLERAGFRTVAFCEVEPYCRAVLAKHWPAVPVFGDVRTLSAELLELCGIEVDAICGGFPCQDISEAGKGAGLRGPRSRLWFEMLRIVDELRPRVVIGEHRTFHGRLMQQLRGLRGLNYGDYSYIEFWQSPPQTSQPTPNSVRRQQYFSVWIRPVTPQTARFALRAALSEVERLRQNGNARRNCTGRRRKVRCGEALSIAS